MGEDETKKDETFDVSNMIAEYIKDKIEKKNESDEDGKTDSSNDDNEDKKAKKKLKKSKKKKHKHKRSDSDDRRRKSEERETSLRRRSPHSRSERRSSSRDNKRNEQSSRDRRNRSSSRDRRTRSSSRSRRRRSRSPINASRSRTKDEERRFNKQQLLEVARNNVKRMVEQGTLPKGVNVDADRLDKLGIKSKDSVDHFTEICRRIQNNEDVDEEDLRVVSHPFNVQDRPLPSLYQGPKIKETIVEIMSLSCQFPVSSGSTHRQKEIEWKNNDSKDAQAGSPEEGSTPANMALATIDSDGRPVMSVAPTVVSNPLEDELRSLTVTQLISRKVEAFQKLEKDPDDHEAKQIRQLAERILAEWNQSQKVGTLLDAPDVKFLSPEELQQGPQAWVRKDQLQSTKALEDGIGMRLLKKMGWIPGTALGKRREGTLVPIQMEIKVDRKGLVARKEESISNNILITVQMPTKVTNENGEEASQEVQQTTMAGKHPVSALIEWTIQQKKPLPEFVELDSIGPVHKRSFLFQVTVEGKTYKPSQRSANKKLAKALAAMMALKDLGQITEVDRSVDMSMLPKTSEKHKQPKALDTAEQPKKTSTFLSTVAPKLGTDVEQPQSFKTPVAPPQNYPQGKCRPHFSEDSSNERDCPPPSQSFSTSASALEPSISNALQQQSQAFVPASSSYPPPSESFRSPSQSYPSPYAATETYLQSSDAYLQSSEAYLQSSEAYQSFSQTYPPPSQTYPPPSHSYPPPSHSYPPPSHSYPPPSHSYPPPSHSYPSPSHSYPSPSHSYPSPSHSYPSPSHSYPPPSHSYPPPSHSYPPHSPAAFNDHSQDSAHSYPPNSSQGYSAVSPQSYTFSKSTSEAFPPESSRSIPSATKAFPPASKAFPSASKAFPPASRPFPPIQQTSRDMNSRALSRSKLSADLSQPQSQMYTITRKCTAASDSSLVQQLGLPPPPPPPSPSSHHCSQPLPSSGFYETARQPPLSSMSNYPQMSGYFAGN